MRRALAAIALAATMVPASVGPAVAADSTEVCRFSDERLDEISGMTLSLRHPGVLWVHNDSSGGPYIYAIDATTCETLARVRIDGIAARDIEAIASGRDAKGRPVLWVADIGDNLDSWPEVRLHRVREPKTIESTTVTARTYRVTYADRPHNAEALLVDPASGAMWIVTRQLAHGRLYALPSPLSRTEVNIAQPIQREGGLVTDGAVSPDGSRYVLRNYVDATVFAGLPPGSDPVPVAMPFQPQGEAVTWTADGRDLLVASERDNRLLRVSVGDTGQSIPSAGASSGASAPTVPSDPAGASTSASPSVPDDAADSPLGGGAVAVAVAAGLVLLAAAGIAIAEVRRRRARDG